MVHLFTCSSRETSTLSNCKMLEVSPNSYHFGSIKLLLKLEYPCPITGGGPRNEAEAATLRYAPGAHQAPTGGTYEGHDAQAGTGCDHSPGRAWAGLHQVDRDTDGGGRKAVQVHSTDVNGVDKGKAHGAVQDTLQGRSPLRQRERLRTGTTGSREPDGGMGTGTGGRAGRPPGLGPLPTLIDPSG